MTTYTSLFACPAAEVTLERVRALVAETPVESLTVEYKERYSPGVVRSIAAMANSYGGIVVLGVTDAAAGNRFFGVEAGCIEQVANACHEALEPPWQPEIITLPLEGADERYVLVVRIDPTRAPRPVLQEGRAPIRLPGRNATADRSRLRLLFEEAPPPVRRFGRTIPAPQLSKDQSGDPIEDFILRCGLLLPVDESRTWRPLSEAGVKALADALSASPLQPVLLSWTNSFGARGLNLFDRRGLNRARRCRLTLEALAGNGDQIPLEAVAVAELPETYGTAATTLTFALDVVVRAEKLRKSIDWAAHYPNRWRLTVPDLHRLLTTMLATLADVGVVYALADLAGVDPVIVGSPTNLDFVTGPPVDQLLDTTPGLVPLPEAGSSHGANLIADPTLNPTHPADRRTQVDAWMIQIALDGGLRGMEGILDRLVAPPS